MYGGIATDAAVDLRDTWIWNGQSWTEVDDGGPGPAIARFPFLANTGSDLVLFGISGSGMVTAVWNGHGWAPRDVSAKPPGRLRFAMAAYGDTTVVFGGLAFPSFASTLGDTWVWDGGAAWAELSDGGSDAMPPARWSTNAASLGSAGGGPGILLFGGYGGAPGMLADAGPLADSWTWNGSVWSRAHAGDAGSPSGRALPAMATASGSGVLLFGGLAKSGNPLGDTWTYSASTGWRPVSTSVSPAPSPRSAAGMAGRP
jgi:hypothetical protein